MICFLLKNWVCILFYRLGVIQTLRNGLRREGGSVPGVTPIVLNNRMKVKRRYKKREEGGSEYGTKWRYVITVE